VNRQQPLPAPLSLADVLAIGEDPRPLCNRWRLFEEDVSELLLFGEIIPRTTVHEAQDPIDRYRQRERSTEPDLTDDDYVSLAHLALWRAELHEGLVDLPSLAPYLETLTARYITDPAMLELGRRMENRCSDLGEELEKVEDQLTDLIELLAQLGVSIRGLATS
jgi:hypothetical protein